MNTDEATTQMKAKITAFFETATPQDISALLAKTNYDFYKNVKAPEEILDEEFAPTTEAIVMTLEIPMMEVSHQRVSNRPIISIGRGHPAADHQDLALAA